MKAKSQMRDTFFWGGVQFQSVSLWRPYKQTNKQTVTSCQSWSSQEKVCRFGHSSQSVWKRFRPRFESNLLHYSKEVCNFSKKIIKHFWKTKESLCFMSSERENEIFMGNRVLCDFNSPMWKCWFMILPKQEFIHEFNVYTFMFWV